MRNLEKTFSLNKKLTCFYYLKWKHIKASSENLKIALQFETKPFDQLKKKTVYLSKEVEKRNNFAFAQVVAFPVMFSNDP